MGEKQDGGRWEWENGGKNKTRRLGEWGRRDKEMGRKIYSSGEKISATVNKCRFVLEPIKSF
jgi:hypothetical protein